jgi:hypothetical protein
MSDVKEGDSAHLFTVTVDPATSNDIYSACDLALWPPDQSKSLIAQPSSVLAISLCRPIRDTAFDFNVPRRPFGIEETVWLDRYSLEKGNEVLERRNVLADLEASREELEEAKKRLSTYEVGVSDTYHNGDDIYVQRGLGKRYVASNKTRFGIPERNGRVGRSQAESSTRLAPGSDVKIVGGNGIWG